MPAIIQTPTATLEAQNDSSYVPRGDVTGSANFFLPPADGSQPYISIVKDAPPEKNTGDNLVTIKFHDIRSSESDFNLDKDAFQVASGVVSAMSEEDWTNEETIKRVYYPEVVKLILDSVPGSYKVTLFDHTIRRSEKNSPRSPVINVHVDQTARSTEWRVRLHDPEDADSLLKGRYRIINVWRPINGTVQQHPLAFASAETVDDRDLRPTELRTKERTGETAGVMYNPDQKFYYWSGMENDESVFLKCYDNHEGVGKCVPHTSFFDHRAPKDAKGRSSIEVRALVYG